MQTHKSQCHSEVENSQNRQRQKLVTRQLKGKRCPFSRVQIRSISKKKSASSKFTSKEKGDAAGTTISAD